MVLCSSKLNETAGVSLDEIFVALGVAAAGVGADELAFDTDEEEEEEEANSVESILLVADVLAAEVGVEEVAFDKDEEEEESCALNKEPCSSMMANVMSNVLKKQKLSLLLIPASIRYFATSRGLLLESWPVSKIFAGL